MGEGKTNVFNCKNVAENFWNVGFMGDAVLKITCGRSQALSGFEQLSAYRIRIAMFDIVRACSDLSESFER